MNVTKLVEWCKRLNIIVHHGISFGKKRHLKLYSSKEAFQ